LYEKNGQHWEVFLAQSPDGDFHQVKRNRKKERNETDKQL